ncbi:hypothetical protein Ms3S1_35260 [Methylosinus sp. 3S-1]
MEARGAAEKSRPIMRRPRANREEKRMTQGSDIGKKENYDCDRTARHQRLQSEKALSLDSPAG